MKKLITVSAALVVALAATACDRAETHSAVSDSPIAPTCAETLAPAAGPQYAGWYQLFIDSIYAEEARLVFAPAYPHLNGGQQLLSYSLKCLHLAGWPSSAECLEQSNDAFKFAVSYTGNASLSLATPSGQRIALGEMTCH